MIDREIKEYLNANIDTVSNIGAERIVISSILKDIELIYDVKEQLSVEDFNSVINQNIIALIYDLVEKCKDDGINSITPNLIRTISKKKDIDIGGDEYLKVLDETKISDGNNISYYIKELKNLSTYRKSAKTSLNIYEESLSTKDVDYDVFVAKQEEKFTKLLEETKGFESITSLADGKWDQLLLKRSANPKELIGIPTGFLQFDAQIGGLAPGALTVVSAFTKTGKSVLMTNWAVNIAYILGIPVLYIDTEMNDTEFYDRVMSILISKQGVIIPEKIIKNGKYAQNNEAVRAADKASDILKSNKLFHLYMPEFSLEKILSISRRFKRKYGVPWDEYNNFCLVVFDYIKLPEENSLKYAQEYQQLGYFTSGLKNRLAGRENIPVLTAAQLNRSGSNAEENDPTQLGGSLRILQYANTLAYLRNKGEKELEKDGDWQKSGNQVLTLHESSARGGGNYKGWIKYYKPLGAVLMDEVCNISLK